MISKQKEAEVHSTVHTSRGFHQMSGWWEQELDWWEQELGWLGQAPGSLVLELAPEQKDPYRVQEQDLRKCFHSLPSKEAELAAGGS